MGGVRVNHGLVSAWLSIGLGSGVLIGGRGILGVIAHSDWNLRSCGSLRVHPGLDSLNPKPERVALDRSSGQESPDLGQQLIERSGLGEVGGDFLAEVFLHGLAVKEDAGEQDCRQVGGGRFQPGDEIQAVGFLQLEVGNHEVGRGGGGAGQGFAGETLAEASLASPTGYPASARAVEFSTVLLIPKTPVLELIGRNPDLALRMLGSMGAHLRVLVGMLDDLTLKDVETRLLNWLVKPGRAAAGGVIRLAGTKRVLAAELGTSSETLSRTLARLRDQKLIKVAGQTITILDGAGLRAGLQHNLGAG